jgi:hypothetical protein
LWYVPQCDSLYSTACYNKIWMSKALVCNQNALKYVPTTSGRFLQNHPTFGAMKTIHIIKCLACKIMANKCESIKSLIHKALLTACDTNETQTYKLRNSRFVYNSYLWDQSQRDYRGWSIQRRTKPRIWYHDTSCMVLVMSLQSQCAHKKGNKKGLGSKLTWNTCTTTFRRKVKKTNIVPRYKPRTSKIQGFHCIYWHWTRQKDANRGTPQGRIHVHQMSPFQASSCSSEFEY